MDTGLVLAALMKAVRFHRPPMGLIMHSDQGWQYQHSYYQKILKNHGIIQSMSRRGNCLDNSVMENFFGLLKSELLYLQEFNSYEELIEEIHKYINYYNNNRIKAKIASTRETGGSHQPYKGLLLPAP